MKFNRPHIAPTEGELHINEPVQNVQQVQAQPVQQPSPAQTGTQSAGPRFGQRRFSTAQNSGAPQTNTQIPKNRHGQGVQPSNKPAGQSQNVQQNTGSDSVQTEQRTINKILPKFVNRTKNGDRGSAVEFVKSAFDLCKTDAHGNRESFDGKMLMNFWTFDKQSNHQLDFIPAYMDISEWLNVCHMILSGRLHDLTAQARASSQNGYAPFVYQSNGGSMKPIFKKNGQTFGGNGPKATLFKITPAKRDESWVLSAEVYDGVQSQTGLIQVKAGSKPHIKIQVLMSYEDLVRVARMSEMVIQAHIMKLI